MADNDIQINLVELEHQREALDAIINFFPGLDTMSKKDANGLDANSPYANPLIRNAFEESSFIDIKMETGTGKTYTYTRMMYELHEKYGMFKFIVVVPSSAIKEGTKSFLTATYAKQHFKHFFPNVDLYGNVGVINSGDFSNKKGRRQIPNVIREFVEADTNNKNQIQVLLLNDKGFLDKANSSLFKDDYDVNLFGGESSPGNMLATTRPVVIIDEPHRIKRTNNSYKNIIEKIKPEMILRFGATFPRNTTGRGKNKEVKYDYYRGQPQYNLTAADSFNRNLVKGVSVYVPDNASSSDSYRVKSANKSSLTLEKSGKEYEVKVGGYLTDIDNRFQGGLRYESKGVLSNELEVENGMKLVPDTFTNSYQEILIRLALDVHFKTERKNFLRDGYPVKTNALFFIDNIDSYRDRGTGQTTWLKDTFEKLLKVKLEELIQKENNVEYKSFLQETLDNISDSHGGYFASDSKAKLTDAKISEEIDVILKSKEKSLQIKNKKNEWNILRFFFSQWTLREGWDNPNVFTITKLRSSGSEASKIQEVGRGLRLPVDIEGNRLSNEDWWLNFVVDESEKDFAESLSGEINQEVEEYIPQNELIPELIIEKLKANSYGTTRRVILNKLSVQHIIDDEDRVIDVPGLRKILPNVSINRKIRNGSPEVKTVKLVKNNWNEIRNFWKEISKRYMILFEEVDDVELENILEQAISDESIFDNNQTLTISVQQIQKGNEITVSKNYTNTVNIGELGTLPYNKFVQSISNQTNLPITLIHRTLVKRLKTISNIAKVINEKTMAKIVDSWQAKFIEVFATKYHYDALNFSAKTSIIKSDDFVDQVPQGDIGKFKVQTSVDKRNLFEEIFVDSEIPEGEIARIIPNDQVKIFGKIPRRAIQVPTYTGGTTTPDFIYATKNDLFLLIESKSKSLRDSEKVAVRSQNNLFSNLANVEWAKVTDKDQVINLLKNFNN